MEMVLEDIDGERWSDLHWLEYTDCIERYITNRQRLKKLRIKEDSQDPRLQKPARLSYKQTKVQAQRQTSS